MAYISYIDCITICKKIIYIYIFIDYNYILVFLLLIIIIIYIHKYVWYVYLYIHMYTLGHWWMKWSITNLIWLPAGQSQREAKMVFPQSQWSDSLTKRSAGSVPLKVPFPWWFSQRKKLHFGWVPKIHVAYQYPFCFFEGSYDHEGMKEQLSFTFSSWQSEDSRVTIVLEFSLITTLENQRYHWNNGDLMAFY